MKLALVIALAPDRRSGRVLSNILPADKAVNQVKLAITSNQCPDASYPILQAVKISDKLREHRFRVNPGDVESDSESDEPHAADVPPLIPVQLGEGEQMVIINVTTQEEADFLKQLADSIIAAGAEITRLHTSNSAALDEAVSSLEASKQELLLCQQSFAKHEAIISAAKGQIEQLTATKVAADARIAELEAQLAETTTKSDQRIKELETQLTEAAKAKKKQP